MTNTDKKNGLLSAIFDNFLGTVPSWFKYTIIAFMIINFAVVIFLPTEAFGLDNFNRYVGGWVVLGETIFCLAMALKVYPLGPAGLLLLQAVALGLLLPYGNAELAESLHFTSDISYLKSISVQSEVLLHEVIVNLEVILLLIFMVSAVTLMSDGLLFVFSRVLTIVKSKMVLSLLFLIIGGFLSAFLDALTVIAVIITVATGFYGVYHKYSSMHKENLEHDISSDEHIKDKHKHNLDNFRGFLRNLLMHAAVGTTIGGVHTLVGEPQNIIIGNQVGWGFVDFFINVGEIALPLIPVSILICIVCEKYKLFGYGYEMPSQVRKILEVNFYRTVGKLTTKDYAKYGVFLLAGIFIIFALAFHIAIPGFIGLAAGILIVSFTGVIDEHKIAEAFKVALPFVALLLVFFGVVSIIGSQGMFDYLLHVILGLNGDIQIIAFYFANGLLSAMSDNVFVATIYITEIRAAFDDGLISREVFEHLAIATNLGTNIPSMFTPNGQAAFLFLLTSTVAPLIRLSYGKMLVMALPYAFICTIAATISMWVFLAF